MRLQLDFKLYSLGFTYKAQNHDISPIYKHVHINLWLVTTVAEKCSCFADRMLKLPFSACLGTQET